MPNLWGIRLSFLSSLFLFMKTFVIVVVLIHADNCLFIFLGDKDVSFPVERPRFMALCLIVCLCTCVCACVL